MSDPFGAQKERQLLRLKWEAVKGNVFLIRLHVSWWRTDIESAHSRFFQCESETWRILREWAIATPVGYLVPKKVMPFLEESLSALQKEFLAEKNAFLNKAPAKEREKISRSFVFEWVREEITDSLASDRQREEITREAFLRSRRILLQAIENAEKTGCRSREEIIGKASIFNVVGDYLSTRYVKWIEEVLRSRNAPRIKYAFRKIKEDFRVENEPENQKEESFQPPGDWKPLIIVRRYNG